MSPCRLPITANFCIRFVGVRKRELSRRSVMNALTPLGIRRVLETPTRMPQACPDCHKTLYATSTSRPALRATRRATFLYILAGIVAALTFYVALVVLRELLKRPIRP